MLLLMLFQLFFVMYYIKLNTFSFGLLVGENKLHNCLILGLCKKVWWHILGHKTLNPK